MPEIDIAAAPERRLGLSPPFDAPCAERVRQRLGNSGGLTDFRGQSHAPAAGQLVEPAPLAFGPKTNSSMCSTAN